MDFGAAMRIHISHPTHVADLIEFLRRCQCSVEQIGKRTVSVALDPPVTLAAALSLVREGVCYACAGAIESPLVRLGSPLCLDCRSSEGGRSFELDAGDMRRLQWARMEVDSYLRVWQARHKGVRALLLMDGEAVAEPRATAGGRA